MTQPMPEVFEAAGQAYDAALEGEGWTAPVGMYLEVNRAGLAAVVDAVWPLAEDRGRRWAIDTLRDAWSDETAYWTWAKENCPMVCGITFTTVADYLESLAAAPRNEGAQT